MAKHESIRRTVSKMRRTRHPNVDSPLFPSDVGLARHPFTEIIESFLTRIGMPKTITPVSHGSMHGWTYYDPIECFGYVFNLSRDYHGSVYVGLAVTFGLLPADTRAETSVKLLRENSLMLCPARLGVYLLDLVALQHCLHEEWMTPEHLRHRLAHLHELAIYCRETYVHSDFGVNPLPEGWFKTQVAC